MCTNLIFLAQRLGVTYDAVSIAGAIFVCAAGTILFDNLACSRAFYGVWPGAIQSNMIGIRLWGVRKQVRNTNSNTFTCACGQPVLTRARQDYSGLPLRES
jgi:hypothetical protein